MPDEPAWLLPDEPRPIRLMNTIWADRAGVHDVFADADGVGAWLSEVGYLRAPARVRAGDVTEAQGLRDAARAIAAWLTEDPRPIAEGAADVDDAIGSINRVATVSAPVPLLDRDGSNLRSRSVSSGSEVMTALSSAAIDAVRYFSGDLASELRACLGPRCVLYYVRQDARRVWCSPGCGNRARVARHHRRAKGSAR